MQNDTELELTEEISAEETRAKDIPVEEARVEESPAEETAIQKVLAEGISETPAEAAAPIVAKPAAKPTKAKRSRPWPLKILLGLVAILLCIIMFAVTLAGTLVVDLRVMTSQGGIRQIVTQLILPQGLSTGSQYPGLTAAPSQPASKEDLTGPLVDWAYGLLEEQFGEETPLTKEQLTQFLDKSSAKDFLADKIAGAVDDFYNETNETTITRKEVVDLIRDNQQLIKDSFDVEITEEQIQEIQEALEEVKVFDELEEKGFMGVLEETLAGPTPEGDFAKPGTDAAGNITGSVSSPLVRVKQILSYIRMATSNIAIICIAGAFVVLFLLLWLTNFTLPKTLSDTGIVLLVTGLILCVPTALDNIGLAQTLLEPTLLGIVRGVLTAVNPVHFTVLGAGAGLIILSIVAKIIKSIRVKKTVA